MSTEDPRGDWGEWTPGKGVERLRAEMPGVMPDLTEEDYAAADAIIAAAGGSTVNQELTVVLPKLSDADAAEWAARFREEMRHPQRLIVLPPDEDERERAAYARGLSEGRRQATEGWEREWGARDQDGYVFKVEEGEGETRARNVASWPKDRPGIAVSRLVGPWEPACTCPPPVAGVVDVNRGHLLGCPQLQWLAAGPPPGPWEPAEQPEGDPLWAAEQAKRANLAPLADFVVRTADERAEPRTRPRMTDGCGPEHTYRDGCELRPEDGAR